MTKAGAGTRAMRDIFFLLFLAAMFGIALKRPFLFVLTYAYIDIVSPQRLSYFLLNSIPISLLAFAGAFGGWLLIDNKRDSRNQRRQKYTVAGDAVKNVAQILHARVHLQSVSLL